MQSCVCSWWGDPLQVESPAQDLPKSRKISSVTCECEIKVFCAFCNSGGCISPGTAVIVYEVGRHKYRKSLFCRENRSSKEGPNMCTAKPPCTRLKKSFSVVVCVLCCTCILGCPDRPCANSLCVADRDSDSSGEADKFKCIAPEYGFRGGRETRKKLQKLWSGGQKIALGFAPRRASFP